LEDPENPEYTITGLDDDEDYYFAATAFDLEAQESGFSNEVSTSTITLASTTGTAGANPTLDGSGGSEGCFIGIATNDVHVVEGISAVIFLLLAGIMGLLLVRVHLQFLKNEK
jgi:hypothetical protein